ncbi:MAG: cytochrome B [Flavobacteriales bacterium]|nr:cytochrome B [Flavobacteriales bacterium]MCB9193419.1 cytochrome B [Flavobacteriales bacterium]
MNSSASLLIFFHSLLRYGVLLFVAGAGILALRGLLLRRPILVYERLAAIVAVVLCHVQLLFGVIIYIMRFKAFEMMAPVHERYWKYEHISMMLVAITLVTIGRGLSKRARTEPGKQLRIAVFYLIALVIMIVAIPWPITEFGSQYEWM